MQNITFQNGCRAALRGGARPCGRTAKHTRDGHPVCGTHLKISDFRFRVSYATRTWKAPDGTVILTGWRHAQPDYIERRCLVFPKEQVIAGQVVGFQ